MPQTRSGGAALLRRAMSDHGIEAERTFLIGDAETDLQAAKLAGRHGLRVEENTFEEAVQCVLQSVPARAAV
jgi:histidinol phosphatase-like enzyme